MNDKSDLLGQLKIDRTPEPKAVGVPVVWVFGAVLLAAAGGVFLTLQFAPGAPDKTTAAPAISETSTKPANQASASQTPSAAMRVSEAPKQPQAGEHILNASGYITARRMATVSAEVMGLITQVEVEEGMRVSEGQMLAQLDDAIARVDYDLAKAQADALVARRASIEANLQEAQRVLARAKTLKDNEFSSEASVTSAEANVDSLRAELAGLKADIKVAQLGAERQKERLMDHTIRAPFAGVVTVKNAQPGEIVSPSSAGGGFTRTGICTIVDMSSLEIEVDVNEAFIGRVFDGQKVEAQLDAYPDWRIPASVIAIIPTADRAKATVRVRIKIETTDSRILPDMGVKVAFIKA